jgi:hypothetical protein
MDKRAELVAILRDARNSALLRMRTLSLLLPQRREHIGKGRRGGLLVARATDRGALGVVAELEQLCVGKALSLRDNRVDDRGEVGQRPLIQRGGMREWPGLRCRFIRATDIKGRALSHEPTVHEEEGDPREEIVRLETEIEELAETIESCRKLILIAKGAMAISALLIVAGVFGIVTLDPALLIASFGILLGGVVVFGSNNSTLVQARAKAKAAEQRRSQLIGAIELRVVSPGNGGGWLH